MSASQFDPTASAAKDIDKVLACPGYNHIGVQAYGDWVIVWLQTPSGEGAPAVWSAINPEDAKRLGEAIARAGHAAESHDDVYGKKPIIIEQIRQRLVVSITHLLKSEIINGRLDNPELTANRCVELALTELGA